MRQEIMRSIKRCQSLGVKKTINAPLLCLEEKELEIRFLRLESLITVFKKCFREVRDIIPNGYIVFLTDEEGYLLFYDTTFLLPDPNKLLTLKHGVSLTEKSCGSNAVSLALQLRESIYFEPKDHYCDIFSEWYCFAIPLIIDEGVKGCLAFSSVGQRISNEMIAIVKLLARNIMIELRHNSGDSQIPIRAVLTEQQLHILKLFAQGMTSMAVALEMKLSENTIKYHKKKIYKVLGVRSIAEAVGKAVKMGLFSIDNV